MGCKKYPISRLNFYDGIKSIAFRKRTDPFLQYLKELKWDDTPRLDNFITELFTVDEKYLQLAKWSFKSIYLAIVWRTFVPGIKHDEMIIWKGAQGVGKSLCLENMLPFQNFIHHPSHLQTLFKK